MSSQPLSQAPEHAGAAPAASSAGPLLSIVIPVYNEEKILETAVDELVAKLAVFGKSYEIILSENGSRDATVEIGRRLEQRHPGVRLRQLGEPNYGKALRQGILEARGRFVICDEIDLCDVDFYERALSRLESGEAELVVGSKAAKGANDERPLLRRAATLVINGMLRVLLGFKGTDTHGLKAFRREALLGTVKKCVVDKDLFASEFVIRAERGAHRVIEVPIRIKEKRPPSINLFRRVPNVLKNLARLVIVIRLNP